jgi:hypothetical protein
MVNLSDRGFILHFEKSSLKFKTRNTNIAERWYTKLLSAIHRSDFCDKDRLYNFHNNLNDIMDELIHCAESINLWEPIIDLSNLDMNHLHKYFEIMRGAGENPAPFFANAPAKVRYYIERYNILIHKIESFKSGTKRIVIKSANSEKQSLLPDDYLKFETTVRFGTAYINYPHVGKTLYNVFKDDDDIVGEHNIIPLSKYSADTNIYFSDSSYNVDGFYKWFDRNSNWLNSLGFYKNDPKISFGEIPVADLVTDMDRDSIIKMISQYKEYITVTSW